MTADELSELVPLKSRKGEDTITIGVDSATRSCGIAVYKNGIYQLSFTAEFTQEWGPGKLKDIASFFDYIFEFYVPNIVIIEEPLAVRNGRVTRQLNLVGGAIFAVAAMQAQTVDFIHNATVKSLMGIKTKEDSLKKALKITGKKCSKDDESDAILLVESYIKLVKDQK